MKRQKRDRLLRSFWRDHPFGLFNSLTTIHILLVLRYLGARGILAHVWHCVPDVRLGIGMQDGMGEKAVSSL
jgi:hypothetical protein